jgi:hypothetical protein
MRIGPARQGPRHFGPRRHRSIHPESAKRAKQRPVEQGPPSRVKDTGGAAGARNHVPEPDVAFVRNTAILARPPDDLRLHPERTGFGLGVPEGLAARAATHQIDSLKLLPRLVALARCHEREAPRIHLGRGAPFIVRARRQRFQCAGHAVGGDQMMGVAAAE